MEKAREQIQQHFKDQRDNDQEIDYSRLKVEINNLIHMYAPEDTTLAEAEAISIAIHNMIQEPKWYTKAKTQ